MPLHLHLSLPPSLPLQPSTAPLHTVFTRYARVMHMVEPPTALFHPQMLAGALWYGAVLPFLARLKLVGRRLATGARVKAAP